MLPPAAMVKPKVDTLHGEIRTDNYFWIREKTNPEVIAYLEHYAAAFELPVELGSTVRSLDADGGRSPFE